MDLGSFIPAKGTLIIVPSGLLDQWLTEISKFVWKGRSLRESMKRGWSHPDCPFKIFVVSTVCQLKGASVRDIAEADVVICSYRLLYSPVYQKQLSVLSDDNGFYGLMLKTGQWLSNGEWRDARFPALEMFYWRRVVFDEFHELESIQSQQQSSLQHLRAHHRWGLTGTPPADCNAGVIFMSSLFRIDLPGYLPEHTRPGTHPARALVRPDLGAWEGDRLLTEAAEDFLADFARQNAADVSHIRLEEQVLLVHHTPAERALYLAQAHSVPDFRNGDAFKTEEDIAALEEMLKLCSHFRAAGGGGGSAEDECRRIGKQKEQRVARSRRELEGSVRVLLILEAMALAPLKGACICFFGDLCSTTRADAKAKASSAGALVVSTMSAAVTHLVMGSRLGRVALSEDALHRMEEASIMSWHYQRLEEFLCQDLDPGDARPNMMNEVQFNEIIPLQPLAWRAELARATEVLSPGGDSNSGAGSQAAQVLNEILQIGEAESLEACLDGVAGTRVSGEKLAAAICPTEQQGGILLEQLKHFAEQQLDRDELKELLMEQAGCLVGKLRELRDSFGSLQFYRQALAALTSDSTVRDVEARSCSICLEDDLPLARLAITPCAHTFCLPCAQSLQSCAICRQPLSKKDITPVAAELPSAMSVKPPDGRYSAYGTKLAMLVEKLKELRASDGSAKVIVFVQFEDLKRKVASVLAEFGVPAVQLNGNVYHQGNVIKEWSAGANPASAFIMLLSLEKSASGTNLTAASHVVFLHPMLAASAELAVRYEQQAIGRARRLGQLRESVQVWRFVTAQTIEQEITECHQSGLWKRESATQWLRAY